MANVNFFSPDGGTTRYPIEDTEARSRIAGQQSLLKDTVGWTGKNWLKNIATSRTLYGVTYTVNSDKSVTVNGTGTNQNAGVNELNQHFTLPAGNYILSGSPHNVFSETGFRLQIYNWTDSKEVVTCGTDEDVPFSIGENKDIAVRIWFRKTPSTGGSNITFYPMLRKADITDPTYEPYHESVEVMYEEEIHGVNLLKNEAISKTDAGITYTVNADGSITANGTATADSTCFIQGSGWNYNVTVENFLEQGETYILSDGVNSYTGNKNVPNIRMYGYTSAGAAWNYAEITPNTNKTFTVDANMKACHISVYIRVPNGQTVNNLVFKPMLRKADIEDSTYRPYNEQAIQNQLNAQGVLGAKNLLKVVATSQTVNGVTFTINRDNNGNVTNIVPTGTASGNAFDGIWNKTADDPLKGLEKGVKYTLSGAEGLATDIGYVYVNYFTDPTTRIGGTDTRRGNNGKVNFIIPSEANYIDYGIAILDGKSAPSGFAFYPMVRLASDPDDTYVPYAMTNRELTEGVASKALSLTLSTENATLLRNESKIKGDIVSVRVQLQVTSEIASGTELLRKDGTPHVGFGVAVLGETNTGNMYETYIASSPSNLSFVAKNTIPTGYYALNYTYIQ